LWGGAFFLKGGVLETRLVTTEDFLAIPRPQLQWIVHNQLPHPGMLLIEGPPKAGKSFLAFELARCIGQGIPFLSWPTLKSKVLYLQFDTSELIWRQRLESMKLNGVDLSGSSYTIHPEDMCLPFNILNPQHYKWLREVVHTSDIKVTIIDVFREIHNADENDSTQMKIVGDLLMSIFKDRTLVLVHHSKKISDEVVDPDPSNVSRGSSYLTGKVDSLWLLWKNALYIQGRSSEQQYLKLKQNGSGLWEKR
jgi:RecA-family ATPase